MEWGGSSCLSDQWVLPTLYGRKTPNWGHLPLEPCVYETGDLPAGCILGIRDLEVFVLFAFCSLSLVHFKGDLPDLQVLCCKSFVRFQ
jgi:hypothetical protein